MADNVTDLVLPTASDTATPEATHRYLSRLVGRLNDSLPGRRRLVRVDNLAAGNTTATLAPPGMAVGGVALVGLRRVDAAPAYTAAVFADWAALGDGRIQVRFVGLPASGRYTATLEVIENE